MWLALIENPPQDLLIAIRGGGHDGPGLGSCDGGLVIDLSMHFLGPIVGRCADVLWS